MECLRTSSSLLQLISDVLQRRFFVQVCGDVVCFALSEGIELLASLFACFGVARGDEDGCAVLDEAFRDHAANPFGTTGDEHDFVLSIVSKVEDDVQVHDGEVSGHPGEGADDLL